MGPLALIELRCNGFEDSPKNDRVRISMVCEQGKKLVVVPDAVAGRAHFLENFGRHVRIGGHCLPDTVCLGMCQKRGSQQAWTRGWPRTVVVAATLPVDFRRSGPRAGSDQPVSTSTYGTSLKPMHETNCTPVLLKRLRVANKLDRSRC